MQIIIFLLLMSSGVEADSTAQEFKKKNPTVALSLSLLPGGGQFYTGSYLKGVAFAGAQSFFAGGAYYLHFKAEEERRNKGESWEYYSEWYCAQRTNFLWWSALAWAISMSDAYVSAHFYKFKEQGSIQFELDSQPSVPADQGPVQGFLCPGISLSLCVKL